MKIIWEFDDGTVSELEVAENYGTFILDSRRREENANRKERRHCYSLDAIDYEGSEYGTEDTYPVEEEEDKAEIDEVLSHLSDKQRRRLEMRSEGLTYQEIADIEGTDSKNIYRSVESAKKKFIKFYKNTP